MIPSKLNKMLLLRYDEIPTAEGDDIRTVEGHKCGKAAPIADVFDLGH